MAESLMKQLTVAIAFALGRCVRISSNCANLEDLLQPIKTHRARIRFSRLRRIKLLPFTVTSRMTGKPELWRSSRRSLPASWPGPFVGASSGKGTPGEPTKCAKQPWHTSGAGLVSRFHRGGWLCEPRGQNPASTFFEAYQEWSGDR